MSIPPTAGFGRVHVPPRIADLGLSFEKPAGWVLPELPDEVPDFADPTAFVGLAVAMAPYAALVFSVAARPAYGDGTLEDWLESLARSQGLDPGAVEPQQLGDLDGVGCDGIQVADGAVMRLRVLLAEDGHRLLTVTLMAPDDLWPSAWPTFERMIASFRLDAPKGATVARPAVAPAPATRGGVLELAEDADSLDPEHPTNAWLRDQGVGLVPRVVDVDLGARRARLASGAIRATFPLPLGWHVIDDGRRVLVFDAGGSTQIEVRRVATDGRPLAAWLDDILAATLAEHPGAEHVRFDADGVECLALRNLIVEGDAVEQVFLLREAPGETLLRARVTAAPGEVRRAMDIVGEVLTGAEFTAAEPAAPDWWLEAQELERSGRIAEAEALIERRIDHVGVHASVAHLHELRMRRLLAAGDRAGAVDAFRRSAARMSTMASQATSGGEGEALSLQANEHRAQLVAALGFDPDAGPTRR
ncbi:MAG: hypothetical protein IPM29_07620 [Planctomycetes bacterium]|nr:hypothetical protein [Planctomycetota bacterium]